MFGSLSETYNSVQREPWRSKFCLQPISLVTLIQNNNSDQQKCRKMTIRLLLSLFHSFVTLQNEIEALKAENDRLKSSGNATPTATPIKTARPPSETSSTSSSSSRQSLGLSLNNLNITDTIMSGQFSVSSGVCSSTLVWSVCVAVSVGVVEVSEIDVVPWETKNNTSLNAFTSQSGLSVQQNTPEIFSCLWTSCFLFQSCWQVHSANKN